MSLSLGVWASGAGFVVGIDAVGVFDDVVGGGFAGRMVLAGRVVLSGLLGLLGLLALTMPPAPHASHGASELPENE